eukprot:jgi/Astpho2/5961/fgenesh1_pm.00080_%23_34_t
MPALSPTMSQGNIAAWQVKEGQEVSPGSLLADIETDKATMAWENQDDGFIAKILKPDGSKDIAVGTPCAILVEDEENVGSFKDYQPDGAGAQQSSGQPEQKTEAPGGGPAPEPSSEAAEAVKRNTRIGPAAKHLLLVNSLSAEDVTPTGPHGIVTKGDASRRDSKGPRYTDIPNSQIRKIIAQRLLESKQKIPHYYLSADADLGVVSSLRKSLKEQGQKASVNDFVVKAAALALQDVPLANARWDEKNEEIVKIDTVDIAIAVATDAGLITPIVPKANTKPLSQISAEVRELAGRARANKLKPHEFQGGSFSISNLGMYGVDRFNAIINPPQACILAVGGTQQHVVLENGAPTAKSVMTVTLSADQRVYDGEVASQFLAAFCSNISNPVRLLS